MTTKQELHRAIDELSEDQVQKIIRLVEVMQPDTSPIHRNVDLTCYRGVLRLTEDPLAYQERMRNEWP